MFSEDIAKNTTFWGVPIIFQTDSNKNIFKWIRRGNSEAWVMLPKNNQGK